MKRILLLLTAFVFSIGLNAQLIPPATSPTLQSIEKTVDQKSRTIADNRSKGILKSGIDYVPVVVHVIHRGEPIDFNDRIIEQPYSANISHDQIISSIDNLNDRFANTWVNYWDDPVENVNARQAVSVNAQVQFSLAKRNPQGGPTDGIIRHNINNLDLPEDQIIKFIEEGINILGYEGTGSDKGAGEIAIKEAIAWDPDKYLNIYVVPEIMDNNSTCGVVWHSTFPSESNSQGIRDGIIIQANRMGYGAHTGSLKGLNIDLVQAAAQYLMLYPVWYGNLTCDDAIDAFNAGKDDPDYCLTNGDRVCDTDPIPWGCNSNCLEDPCAALENNPMPLGWESTTTNYMYPLGSAFCPDHFTQGQVDRMQACLEGPRNSLITASDVLTPLNVYDLKTDVSVERTCYDNYKPTVIVTNTGYNDVTEYTVSVDISTLGISYTLDQDDLGVIPTGKTLNVTFPELVIPNNGFYNLVANASITVDGTLEPFTSNNTAVYPLTKYSDGFIDITATYRGSSGYPLYSIRNTDSGDLVLDTKKIFNNIAASAKEDFHANNYAFAGFLEYGGALAEEYGIDGDIAPNATYWIGTSGPLDELPYTTVNARYYLVPGNYTIAISSNRQTTNNGIWSIFSTYGCDPANDGTTCSLTVDALSNLLTELDELYTLDGYSPLNATGTNPYGYSAEYEEIAFTVVSNNDYSESCCTDSNGDGICDGFNLNELDPSIVIYKDPNIQPTSITMSARVDREGVAQLDEVKFQLASDVAFTNIVAEEIVPYSQVNEEYFLLKKQISVDISGLSENTQYYGRAVINDRGQNYFSNTVAERTTVDACGGATSITFNAREYPLVTIGNQCWFAKNLQSDRLAASAGGASITDGTLASDWWTAFQGGGTPAYAAVDGLSSSQLWDNGYGYFYNVTAAMSDGLCPDGFRVPYNADWMQLDTALGFINTGSKLMLESRGGTNSTGFSDPLAGRRYATGGAAAIADPSLGTASDNNQGGYSVFWVQDPFILSPPLSNWTSADSANGFKDNYGLGASTNGEHFGNYMFFNNLWYYNQHNNFGGYSVRCMKGGIGDNGVPEITDVCTKYATLIDTDGDGFNETNRKNCNYNPAGTVYNATGCNLLDECGVCGGSGIPDGFCNCEGEVPDAVGVCGGPCPQDEDGDGICDVVFRETGGDESLCDYEYALNYRGVDYAIGGYGGNCWFLDNLRTDQWRDGSFITSSDAGSTWVSNSNAGLSVVNTRPDLSVTDRNTYGYLYNWFAVNDAKGLCPTGWHVSSEEDWVGLERALGMPENQIIRNSIRGEDSGVGQVLRTGAIEFNAQPAGIITGQDGRIRGSGLEAYLWTSTPWNTLKLQYQNNAWHRAILGESTTDGIVRYNHSWGTSGSKKHGLSVRCVKDK